MIDDVGSSRRHQCLQCNYRYHTYIFNFLPVYTRYTGHAAFIALHCVLQTIYPLIAWYVSHKICLNWKLWRVMCGQYLYLCAAYKRRVSRLMYVLIDRMTWPHVHGCSYKDWRWSRNAIRPDSVIHYSDITSASCRWNRRLLDGFTKACLG